MEGLGGCLGCLDIELGLDLNLVELIGLELRVNRVQRFHDIQEHGSHELTDHFSVCIELICFACVSDEDCILIEFGTDLEHEIADLLGCLFVLNHSVVSAKVR